MGDICTPDGWLALAEAEDLSTEVIRLWAEGNFDAAIPLAERALTTSEIALGLEHPYVAASLTELAMLYHAKGDYSEAEPLFQRALAIREKTLGLDHPDVATSLNNLAELYIAVAEYSKAEPLHLRALAIREKALGPEDPEVAESLNNLAWLCHMKGDYANAEPRYRRALAIVEKALGPEHPRVANLLNNLAALHHAEGEFRTAEPLCLRALSIVENALGPEHPEVANVLNILAGLYHAKGDYGKAEPLFRRALSIVEAARGPEHHHVVAPLNNLALIHSTKGDFENAEPLYVRALAIVENALGPEHPEAAPALNNLAALYHMKGDYGRAESLFQSVLAIREKALGPEHSDVAGSLNNLAVLYMAKGDYSKAKSLCRRALAIWENGRQPEHTNVGKCLNQLAVLCHTERDYGEAESHHVRALVILENALGPEHPDVAPSLSNLAALYVETGDHENAEPLYLRALGIMEKALGPEHPDVARVLNNFAGLYHDKGDYALAEEFWSRAVAIDEKALWAHHPNVAISLCNLAMTWAAQGESVKAWQTLRRATTIQDRNATMVLTTGSEEQKRAYMSTLNGSTAGVVSLHVQAAPSAQDAMQLAFTTILRRKGRVLDAMADGFAALRRHARPADQALLAELQSVSAQYSNLVWRGPDKMPLDQYREMVLQLDMARQHIEWQLSSRSSDLQADLQPITLEQVRAAIPQETVLVELFEYRAFNPKAGAADRWRGARVVAYVLPRSGEIRWADLGESAPIDLAVDQLRRVLAHAASDARDLDVPPESAADPRQAARDLDRLVMQPIRDLLGSTRHILLSPDGALNLVPFGALVDEEGRYLVERYTFTYLTSGRDLLRFATHRPSQQGPVVIAAPDYDAAVGPPPTRQDDGTRASSEVRQLRFLPLRHAAEEGRAVACLLGTEPLIGVEATETAVKEVKGPQVLHIATHGFYLPNTSERPAPLGWERRGMGLRSFDTFGPPMTPMENPLLRSGLAMAGANRRDNKHGDGLLTALEMSQLDLTGTKLVVLSACDTGVGEIHSGDGVYGLRRALVMAGAETQVMSLWSVDDATTRDLMDAYYEKLLAGDGRSEALRQAQIEMLRRQDRAHPYYWASFIVSGNGAPLYEKS